MDRVALIDAAGGSEWRSIRAIRPHKKFFLVWFEGVQSVEDADQLIGKSVAVSRDQLPQLDEGELYHIDLIGCRVELESTEEIGRIEEILTTGSNDVLVVRKGDTEVLVPLIDDVVISVDLEEKRVVVDPIEGLLDPQ